MDGEIGALLTAQGPDPMVRSPVTGAVNIAVISAAVHALAEQFDELGLHEAASGWEHEGSENWSTEQRLQVDTLLQRLEGLRSSMNEVLHDPDPSALRASLSDGMLEQALTADVLSGLFLVCAPGTAVGALHPTPLLSRPSPTTHTPGGRASGSLRCRHPSPPPHPCPSPVHSRMRKVCPGDVWGPRSGGFPPGQWFLSGVTHL